MYPVLFRIGSVPVDAYYVIWFAALALALRWSVSRMELYGIDDGEGRRVIAWGFLGMLAGARAAEIIENFPAYWSDPSLILDLNSGGLSERGAILGAFVVTLTLCLRGRRVSFFRLCEAVVLPGFLVIAVGRWGCFFAGCCVGVASGFPGALHFPYDPPGVTRHATQIYYSASAALSLAALMFFEKRFIKPRQISASFDYPPYPVLTPLGMIFYSVMRIAVDSLRLGRSGAAAPDFVMAAMIAVGAVWFALSWKAFRGSGGKAE